MAKELEKQYNPSEVENRTYDFWCKNKYFHAKREEGKKTYTIVIPPPNITGQLHMGHALDNTLQDILIRYHRMAGYDTLWLPGTDHASIATEAKIVEKMREEGITKDDLGRDKFLERAWAWKEQYGGRIIQQLKKMGSSCDWDRERFTLDEGCSKAVKEVFVGLYDKGLIYRGNRMVNWCPHCNTSISDAEVEYEEKDSNFWHLLYTVKETGEQLELATTRPETMLGDTAVAINGDDPRYKHLHGCHVILPLLNKEIPIVCDEHADMTKGTGVVKITGKAPFDTVLIHGLVRDAQGRKMSKSLGNGIDPLEIIDKYGADALRFTLATGNSPGNDMRFSDDKVLASRNFANKLWNAARFVLMYLGEDYKYSGLPSNLLIEDKWIVSKVNSLAKEVTDNLEKYELGIAVQKLYDFIWDVFCDWYIEIAKIRLQGDDEAAKDDAKAVLVFVLTYILKLLHPFMPFITEEIYQAIPHDCESIMISKWCEYDENLNYSVDEAEMEKIMTAIKAIRNRRSEMNIPPSKKAKVYIETAQSDVFLTGIDFVKRLASASEVTVDKSFGDLGNVVTIITDDAKIYIPLGDLVDFEAEKKRLEKELAAAEDKLAFIMKKLNNPGFVNKAPEKVVQQNRDDAAKAEDKIAMLKKSIEEIQ